MSNSGYKNYTNGLDTKMFIPGTEPNGWFPGRLNTKNGAIKKSLLEKLTKEKLQYLYSNFSVTEILLQLDMDPTKQAASCLRGLVRLWGITRTKEEFHNIESRINREIIINYTWTESAREKRNSTISNWTEGFKQDIRAKVDATKESRYGNAHYNNRKKAEQTIITKYGSIENMYQLASQQTVITKKDKYGSIKKCIEQGMIRNFGSVEEAHKQSKLKEIATKKQRHNLNTSKIEQILYTELCEQYGRENVIYNYNTDVRYPFACDFYIISEDKFIELNRHWTHGGMLYDPNSLDCQEKLQKWQEKAQTSQFYRNAIETWTQRDVLKLKYAIENNLNYEIIW